MAKKPTKAVPAAKKPKAVTATETSVAESSAAPTQFTYHSNLRTRDEAIRAYMNSVNSDDRKIIASAEEAGNPYALRRPTGIIGMDLHLAGGFPAGGCCMLSGPDNCLDGLSFVQFETRRADGVRSNHKGGSLEKLYARFHNLSGKETEGLKFYAPSVNDEGGVLQNEIKDVVRCGIKECFEIKTKGGHTIVSTDMHKFLTEEGYVRLKNLRVGSDVFVHTSTPRRRTTTPAKKKRGEVNVLHHPVAGLHIVKARVGKDAFKEYRYHRLARARVVVEANMNGLDMDAYIARLNAGHLDGLKVLQSHECVHHLDENTTNDSLENLVVLSRAEHMREHLKEPARDNMFRFMATLDTIVSIKPVGRRETYDLKMTTPFHNYVANKFVVHNSGKTYLAFRVLAMQQKLYGASCRVAVAITEGAFAYDQAIGAGMTIRVPDGILEQWQEMRRQRGIPLYTNEELAYFKRQQGEVYVVRGQTGEEILETVLGLVKTNALSCIVVDSINGLKPSADADKDMDDNEKRAAQAGMMSKFFSFYAPLTTGLNGINPTTLLFTQQVRSNQERANAPAHIQKYLKPWAVSGGYAAKHYKLIDLLVWEGKKLKKGGDDGRETIGKVVNYMMEKGKAGTHDNIEGNFNYYYGRMDVDAAGDLMLMAMQLGIMVKRGTKVCIVQKDSAKVLEEYTAPSEKAMRSMLETDFEFELGLRREILAASGVKCLYR